MKRPVLLILFASVLAACEAPPRAPSSEGSKAPAPQPEILPAPPPEPTPLPPGPPASPESKAQAQKVAVSAADMLQSGNEDAARPELKRALALDPQNRIALSLTKQMTADPIAMLGKESFAYTIRQGDTLALLAQRFLGDPYLFYILARYNDIKVPKQVSVGQVVRVPGKAPAPAPAREPAAPTPAREASPAPAPSPPPAAAPSPPPAPTPPAPPPPPPPPTPAEQAMRDGAAAERAGDPARAMAAYRKADGLGQAGAAAKAEQMRQQLIARNTLAARNAFTKQDLAGAIANWQRVLDLDPGNTTARSEQDRARALQEKLKNVK